MAFCQRARGWEGGGLPPPPPLLPAPEDNMSGRPKALLTEARCSWCSASCNSFFLCTLSASLGLSSSEADTDGGGGRSDAFIGFSNCITSLARSAYMSFAGADFLMLIRRAASSAFSSFFAAASSTVENGSALSEAVLSLSLSEEGAPGGPLGGGGIIRFGGFGGGGRDEPAGAAGAGAGAGAGAATPLASAKAFFISSVPSVTLLLNDLFDFDGKDRDPLEIEALPIFGFSSRSSPASP